MKLSKETLLQKIEDQGAKGCTYSTLLGISKKDRDARMHALDDWLNQLIREKAIDGPHHYRKANCYFIWKSRPEVQALEKLDAILKKQGHTLIPGNKIKEELGSLLQRYMQESIAELKKLNLIHEIKVSGKARYIHLEQIKSWFPSIASTLSATTSSLPFDDKRIKEKYLEIVQEQRGNTTVAIGTMIKRLGCDIKAFHQHLLECAKQNKVELHQENPHGLSEEIQSGALTLPGWDSPFIYMTWKS